MQDSIDYVFTKFPGIERMGREAVSYLIDACVERGWSYDDLFRQIWLESGFKANALTWAAQKDPRQTASGLIQMIGATVKWVYGWRDMTNKQAAAKLRAMSALQQAPGVIRFYEGAGGKGRVLSGADFRLLGYGIGGARLDSPDSAEIYPKDSDAADLNPTAQGEGGGITFGGIRREWHKWDSKVATFPRVTVDELPADSADGAKKKMV